MKSKIDKFDVDKLVPVPVDLIKRIDVLKNDFAEKDVMLRSLRSKLFKIKYRILLT